MNEFEGVPSSSLRLPENSAVDKYSKERANWSHLVEASVDFTPERKMIVESLMERTWFQRTSPELQLELAQLPDKGKGIESHDGFLADLAGRPDNINGLEVIRLDKLPRGNFALIPTFKVKNEKGDEYTYEYVSWRYGQNSGAKGLAFIRNNEEITHFVILKGGEICNRKDRI